MSKLPRNIILALVVAALVGVGLLLRFRMLPSPVELPEREPAPTAPTPAVVPARETPSTTHRQPLAGGGEAAQA